jgi:hypothetical protein
MAERSECIPELLKTLKPFLMECTGDLRPGNNDTSATARDKSRERGTLAKKPAVQGRVALL